MRVELTLWLNEVVEELGVTLTNSDWELLEKLVSLLEIYQQLTVKMSDRYANASVIIPEIMFIRIVLDKKETKKVLFGLGATLTKLVEEMKNRYSLSRQPKFDASNFLLSTL